MKLIIEHSEGNTYVYQETDDHFKKADRVRRGLKRMDFDQLAYECKLPDDTYVVVDLPE